MVIHTKSQQQWDHGTVSQIPRNSLIMIMAAFAMVVIPHAAQLSMFIIAIALFCVAWRWLIFLGQQNFPSFWLKAALVSGSVAAVMLTEGVSKKLETWAALLIVAFSLKLLEMKTQRDAYVVVFLSYFIISVEFIFNHSIGIVMYELFAVMLVTAAIVGMNQFHTRVKPMVSMKLAIKILAQAIPLMLVIFILFPRIGPIWSIANPNQTARSGLGEQMTPGDIAKLAKSDEIVFRAIFNNAVPPNDEMYWRGRVYSDFNQGTWSYADIPRRHYNIQKVNWAKGHKRGWFVPELKNDNPLTYSVILEPTHNQWLFGLNLALPQTEATGLTWDYRLINRLPVQTLLRYKVNTYPNAILNTWLPEFLRIQTTQIDPNDNPRIINFARDLYAQSQNTKDYVDKVLHHIRTQPFHYTLEPPTLQRRNSVDQFWFDTRAGFCTHYAGAFVYLLRAAGIPARMVGGYQGGEINPLTGHIIVRQYMAHAWAEYWLPNKGWQRIDPTAAVAPSRIADGLDAALPESDLSSLSAFTNLRFSGALGLQRLMLLFETIEYRWNLFVIGYDSDLQTDFLQKLLGKITIAKIAIVLLIGALLSMSFVALSLIRQRGKQSTHPVIKIVQSFTKRVRKLNLYREPEESPAQFIEKIGMQRGLKEKDYRSTIIMINELLYNPNPKDTKDKLKVLKNNLQILQYKLALKA